MLKNIKSVFSLKFVSSKVIEKRILELIRYNKSLQNKLDKSLLNYRIFSGQYIIYETFTKGKLYDAFNNNLLYEGEFLNSKKNGKGKEYFNNYIFEGEYLNGKRNGKFKEYDIDSKLIFEGEYINNKRNGKWKEYYYNNI